MIDHRIRDLLDSFYTASLKDKSVRRCPRLECLLCDGEVNLFLGSNQSTSVQVPRNGDMTGKLLFKGILMAHIDYFFLVTRNCKERSCMLEKLHYKGGGKPFMSSFLEDFKVYLLCSKHWIKKTQQRLCF